MRNIHVFEVKNMLRMANEARERSYAPYTERRVGVCLKGATGAYYLSCNIETVSYWPENCAERTAIFKAVYEGERSFDALAIVSDGEALAVPCGLCRQTMAEFCDAEMPVICANGKGEYKLLEMGELLDDPYCRKAF